MSTRVSFLDFDREVQVWLDAFTIAEKDQRSTFYHRYKAELRVLRYLEVHQGKVTIQRHPMLEIMASYKVAKRNADMVRIDFETVWSQYMARSDRSIHAFNPTDTGFDFLFAVAMSDKYVMTGVIHVNSLRD